MAIADIIILVLAIILLGLAGGFLAKAAYDVSKVPTYNSDDGLKSARSYLVWGSVICFVGLFFVIVLMGLNFAFGKKTTFGASKWIMVGMIGLTLILIFIAGVLAAVGATRLKSNAAFNSSSFTSAYNYAIAAAVTLLVGMSILFIIYLIIFLIRKPDLLTMAQEKLKKMTQSGQSGQAGQVPMQQVLPVTPVQAVPVVQPVQVQPVVAVPVAVAPPVPPRSVQAPSPSQKAGVAAALSQLASTPEGQQTLNNLLTTAMARKVKTQ